MDKWTKTELKELTDDELAQLASDAGVPIEDFDTRAALQKEMVGKAKPAKKRPDNVVGTDKVPAAALKGKAKVEDKEVTRAAGKRNVKGGKPGDIVTLHYVGKGTAVVGGLRWSTGVRREMTRAEAQPIRGKLAKRFVIEG